MPKLDRPGSALDRILISRIAPSISRLPMVWCVAFLALGILLYQTVSAGALTIVIVAVCLPLFFFTPRRTRKQLFWLTLAGTSALAAGYSLTHLQQPPDTDPLGQLARRESQPIALRAVIASAASWRPNPNHRAEDPNSSAWRTRWEITCTGVMENGDWTALTAKSTLSTDGRVSDLLPGDQVTIWGSYRALPSPTNPGEFDLSGAMRQKHQFWSVDADSREQIELRGCSGKFALRRVQAIAARSVDGWLQRSVGTDHAPLAAALIIGQREQVDWQQQEELMATGTLHLLAISGLHVEVVATLAAMLCVVCRCRTRTQCFLPIALCLAYAVLAGGKPPVLRALILVSTINIARLYGRESRIANSLAFAGFVLLVMRTAHLTNVGVQLSFVAVGSLALLSPEKASNDDKTRLIQLTERSRGIFSLMLFQVLRFVSTSLRISSCVWLATCPLIWNHFHVIPWIAIPLNVCISIPLSFGLVAGLVTGLIGWCSPVAAVSGFVCRHSLDCVQSIVDFGHRIPGGHLWLPAPSLTWMFTYYATCCVWLLIFRGRKLRLLALLLIVLIACQVILFAPGPRGYIPRWQNTPLVVNNSEELRCTFLDVGHGTSVILEMPNGNIWLYDAGQMGRPLRSFENIAESLWELDTASIDTLILSHADADHYNGVIGLSRRFSIRRIASTPQFWNSQDIPLRATLQAIKQAGIATESWHASREEWESTSGNEAGVAWTVLHPDERWSAPGDNADSLCLLLEYAGRRILLPGDLEGAGLVSLTQLPPRGIDVLMAPHHGSSTLDPDELLRWCRPKWTVISGNHRAMRRSVLQQYAGKTRHLAVTFRDGAIQVRITATGELSCYRYSDEHWIAFEDQFNPP